MSYADYTDMFWDAQEKNAGAAPYRMLAIDIMNSSARGYDPEALDALAMETVRLIDEDRALMPIGNAAAATDAWVACDPTFKFVVLGDFRAIVLSEPALRARLGLDKHACACDIKEEIDAYLEDILYKAAELAAIDFDFHWENGVFETWNWAEGNEKYALCYCTGQLEELSKENEKVIRAADVSGYVMLDEERVLEMMRDVVGKY